MISGNSFTSGLELGTCRWEEAELANLDPFDLRPGLVITAMQNPHDVNVLERAICVRLIGDPDASPAERNDLIEKYAYFHPTKDHSRQYVGSYPALGAMESLPPGYVGTTSDYQALVFPFDRSRVHLSNRFKDHQSLSVATLGFSVLLLNSFYVQPISRVGTNGQLLSGRNVREVFYWKVDEDAPALGIRRHRGGRLITADSPPGKNEPLQKDYPQQLARFVVQKIAASKPKMV